MTFVSTICLTHNPPLPTIQVWPYKTFYWSFQSEKYVYTFLRSAKLFLFNFYVQFHNSMTHSNDKYYEKLCLGPLVGSHQGANSRPKAQQSNFLSQVQSKYPNYEKALSMELFSRRRWRLDRPKQKAVVFVLNPKNYATRAWHNSIVVWLLGQSSCSSPSTKELHALRHSWGTPGWVDTLIVLQQRNWYCSWFVNLSSERSTTYMIQIVRLSLTRIFQCLNQIQNVDI